MGKSNTLDLTLRTQQLVLDKNGRNIWQVTDTPRQIASDQAALVICDVWDRHWSRGANERLEAMLPRMNQTVSALRGKGAFIVHAPSDTISVYDGTPARQRMQQAPPVEPPSPIEHDDPPLPIDDSDGGNDTNEAPEQVNARVWSRQHERIDIDQTLDGISDDGRECYNAFRQRSITFMMIMGVHTNMCVLNRSFAIKQMVRWGFDIALIRDLTDTMYNPALPPYVNHEAGTELVIAYIEKFWCPTLDSTQLLL